MKKYEKYKRAILVLSILVLIESLLLIFLWSRRVIRPPVVVLPPRPKIAIVIDDWGYDLNSLNLIKGLNLPLTLALLPNLSFSEELSQELHRQGFEIILHLPMEPNEKHRLEQDTIMVSMDEGTIINIIRKDLSGVYNVRGVSNHMGSRVTTNPRIMGIIFNELKERGLYFLDSFVSDESVCLKLAAKMQVLFARRDVFIDNIQKPEYIKNQINKLKRIARIYGKAIGIGHCRKITLEVLKEIMPQIEREGYKFVFVSEIIRTQKIR